jgi:ATP-binding cassette subfamily B protein
MAEYREEEKIEKLNLSVWKNAFRYLFPHWKLIILICLSMAVTSFYDSSFTPSMNAGLINAGNLAGYSNVFSVEITVKLLGIPLSMTFQGYIIFYIIMIIVRSISVFITFYTMNYFNMIIMTGLRRDGFKRIQELSFSYYDKTPSGWLIARLQNDASSIGDVMTWDILRIFWILFDTVFTLITMFATDWKLSLLILATTPIVGFLTLFFEKIILKYHRQARNAYSDFVRWLAECINGNKTIKTMAIEESIYKECDATTENVRKKRYKAGNVSAPYYPLTNFVSTLTTCLIIIVFPILGVEDKNTYTIATLILFLGFVGSIYNPIADLSDIISDLMATQASVEKLFSLINTKPTLVDTPEVIAKYGDLFNNKKENFEKLKGDIYFKDVCFSYNPETEVIHDMNLHILEGTSCAIVGETGSGKSTTVNLLCRFYEPTKGEVLIDGVNYKERSVGWIRSNIGYVQQSPFIFKGSVKENIKYGKHDATDEEIIDVCKKLDVHDFIMSLKNGYDTILDDGGDELSQGQKQLISFARALVRDPRILILDEATSSIDTETEAVIQKSVNKMLSGRTSIIIAHRLSTIVDCSRIIVMKDGKIIEDGNHVSLMNKKGYYYELYMNQFKELDVDSQINTYQTQIEDKKIKI